MSVKTKRDVWVMPAAIVRAGSSVCDLVRAATRGVYGLRTPHTVKEVQKSIEHNGLERARRAVESLRSDFLREAERWEGMGKSLGSEAVISAYRHNAKVLDDALAAIEREAER